MLRFAGLADVAAPRVEVSSLARTEAIPAAAACQALLDAGRAVGLSLPGIETVATSTATPSERA